METLGYILIGLIAGFLVGWHLHANIVAKIMADILEVFGVSERDLLKTLDRLKKKQQDNICHIRVEQDEYSLRAYRIDDEQFLAQADDVEQLVDRIVSKVGKGVYVQCSLENGGDIFRKQAENYQKNLH